MDSPTTIFHSKSTANPRRPCACSPAKRRRTARRRPPRPPSTTPHQGRRRCVAWPELVGKIKWPMTAKTHGKWWEKNGKIMGEKLRNHGKDQNGGKWWEIQTWMAFPSMESAESMEIGNPWCHKVTIWKMVLHGKAMMVSQWMSRGTRHIHFCQNQNSVPSGYVKIAIEAMA